MKRKGFLRFLKKKILIKHILKKFPSCSSFGLFLKSKMQLDLNFSSFVQMWLLVLTDIYTFSAYLMNKFHCRNTYAYKMVTTVLLCSVSFACSVWFLFSGAICSYISLYLSFIDLALPLFSYLLIICSKFQGRHFRYQVASSFTLVICWLILFQSYDLILTIFCVKGENLIPFFSP
jgi:hypothetical protein